MYGSWHSLARIVTRLWAGQLENPYVCS